MLAKNLNLTTKVTGFNPDGMVDNGPTQQNPNKPTLRVTDVFLWSIASFITALLADLVTFKCLAILLN